MHPIHPTIATTLVSQRRRDFESHAAHDRAVRAGRPAGPDRHLRIAFGGHRGVVRRPVVVA